MKGEKAYVPSRDKPSSNRAPSTKSISSQSTNKDQNPLYAFEDPESKHYKGSGAASSRAESDTSRSSSGRRKRTDRDEH